MLSHVIFIHRSLLVQEPRVSTCELEVDVQATDIMNRKEIDMGKAVHDSSTKLFQRRDCLI